MNKIGDYLTGHFTGVLTAIIVMYCRLLDVGDSVQHVVYSLDPVLGDLIKALATAFFGFLGSALALWVKYKIAKMGGRTSNRREG